ncbi:MAG: hypothetical protein ABFD85_03520 [Phycisphaerae bacterium]
MDLHLLELEALGLVVQADKKLAFLDGLAGLDGNFGDEFRGRLRN